jgi:hypothetical protein
MKDFTHENIYGGIFNNTDKLRSLARRIRVPIYTKKDIKNKASKNKEVYCELKELNPLHPFELPTINYSRYNGIKYQYTYGCSYHCKPFSVVKINVNDPNDTLEMKYFEEDFLFVPSEPVFVERPDPTSEDDGVLLVMVLCDQNNDFLSILDAKNLNEIARAYFPPNIKGCINFCFFLFKIVIKLY